MAPNPRELGEMLRSRRERLSPAEVGLPAGNRRRTSGLRREEVAALAAISPTYYTFLEQGRAVTPSRQVLDALASALRLDEGERAHLHELVHGAPPVTEPPAAETLAPGLGALVDRLDPAPAYVTGRRFDVLAANRSVRLLWTDWLAVPVADRNIVWWMFTDPHAREVLVEWEREAAALLGRYRATATRYPDDPSFTALTDRLHAASAEVRAWWPRHQITRVGSGHKLLRHPALGEFRLDHLVLTVADVADQKLVAFDAPAEILAQLAQLPDPPTRHPHPSRT
ncbi:helix-turn-helix transcriptional regulator [Actinocatenispora sera]|uniref:Transcriptional regulator n=1 Tax=Actinocatenispora sera TaxID=390989 RepID=A0A810KWK7_9ACTN|nr:helix-turn-helix transcriptional regulator [Actinocatenispora sera]BCJ26729.1 transcriptional regulator [Actinocatenispora sera]